MQTLESVRVCECGKLKEIRKQTGCPSASVLAFICKLIKTKLVTMLRCRFEVFFFCVCLKKKSLKADAKCAHTVRMIDNEFCSQTEFETSSLLLLLAEVGVESSRVELT